MNEKTKTFNIVPISSPAFTGIVIFLLAIISVPVVVLIVDSPSWTAFVVAGPVCLLVIGLFASFLYQGKNATFSLTESGLTIRPGIYGRTVSKPDIITEEVHTIDLNYEKNYQPQWRTNGAGLPGYLSGWFSLKNGEKALMFVTNRSRVVYIPTRKKYAVMLSVQQAEEMVEAIRQWEK
jgi:hypothetical protein